MKTWKVRGMQGTEIIKWEAARGYSLHPKTGLAEQWEYGTYKTERFCTLRFYLAMPGESLRLLDQDYEYAVATYGLHVDDRYLYTYDYQPEENWTTYRGDFREEKFSGIEYVFTERIYFRIVLRSKTAEETGNHRLDLKHILEWKRLPEVQNTQEALYDKGLFQREVKITARTVYENWAEDSKCFLLLTDTHYTVNGTWEDTAANLHSVKNELEAQGLKVHGVIHLGDITDGMLPADITRDYVSRVMEGLKGLGVPLYYALGNHDSNYFWGNPDRFTPEETRRLYLPKQEHSYYEVVYQDVCLRLIFLDSFDPGEEVRYGFGEEELDWLEGILLGLTADWKILVMSHVPPTARLHYWSDVIRGSRRLLRILKEYHARTGGLIGYIHGHNHGDQVDYKEGFPIISIGCNKCEYFTDKKPQGAVTYERKLHTVTQDLWDVCLVSPRSGRMDLIRFGAGKDRRIFDGTNTIQPEGQLWNRRMEKPMKKVITYGTYDLFHEGHYNLLKRAKELGDYLIVGVTTEHYDEQRGKLNIVDPLLERIENVRRTGFVDEIIIEDHEGQKIEDIQKYNVDIFTLGSDWKGMFDYLKSYCQVIYLERTPGISSTMLRKGKFPIIRMGIVGSGRIAPRFLSEAKYVSGLNVQCVYNPHKESVEEFASEYALVGYSDSFEEFLEAVDAIYIATPHETHYDYVRKALCMGKHVLCEKPMALTRRQAEELFDLAKEKERVLMEGIKTAYCPGFAQIINIAKSGRIGEIRDVEACFSRLTAPNLREMVDVKYGGAFMEFGSYTILPIFKLLGLDYKKVEINSIPAPNGVDLYSKIQFHYGDGFAMSKTGIGVKSEGQLLIAGTKGYILAESPWWLTRKFQVRYEDPAQIETYTPNFVGDGLRYEIGDFVSHINGLGGHAFKLTEEESIAMADVVERFLAKREEEQEQFRRKNREAGVRIWAHRGCSYRFPENTLSAFAAACELPQIAGIELDIQLSRDGELVVFHDETVDRLMDAVGNIREYTLEELRRMQFKDWKPGEGAASVVPTIPTMAEVLELVKPYALKNGIKINIELKNSRVPYEGMEEKILELVKQFGMEEHVVYSSFNAESVKKLKILNHTVETGILRSDVRDCLELVESTEADALHPNVDSMEEMEDNSGSWIIRAWNGREPFYRQNRQYPTFNLCDLRRRGVTDFITNVPEEYL